jgi:hypothetical protein
MLSAKQIEILNSLKYFEPALRRDQISQADGGDIDLGDILAALQAVPSAKFQSAVLAGTGAAQNVAHGLGVVPSVVLASVYNPDSLSEWSIVEGAHTSTNLVLTVTDAVSFKVIAFA